MAARWFAALPRKLHFNPAGELDVLFCPGMDRSIRIVFFGGLAYLYFLLRLKPESPLGRYKKYSLTFFSCLLSFQMYRFSKYLLRMSVVEGGQLVRLEKYPLFGYGHPKKLLASVGDFDGLVPFGQKTWYNPLGWGKGYYKVKFNRRILGCNTKDYVILRIPKDYHKEAFKLLMTGKPVTDKSLRQLDLLKAKKMSRT